MEYVAQNLQFATIQNDFLTTLVRQHTLFALALADPNILLHLSDLQHGVEDLTSYITDDIPTCASEVTSNFQTLDAHYTQNIQVFSV